MLDKAAVWPERLLENKIKNISLTLNYLIPLKLHKCQLRVVVPRLALGGWRQGRDCSEVQDSGALQTLAALPSRPTDMAVCGNRV